MVIERVLVVSLLMRERSSVVRPLFLSFSLALLIALCFCAGSSDSTVLLQGPSSSTSTANQKTSTQAPSIPHPNPIRTILHLSQTPLERPVLVSGSGDLLNVWDVSSFGEERAEEVESLSKIDAHSHEITGLGLWIRQVDVEGAEGKKRKEAWIVSASLDGTIRRWRFDGEFSSTPTRIVNVYGCVHWNIC